MERIDEIRERLAGVPDPIALLEGIFAYLPVGLQIYTPAGRSILTNHAFRKMFGSEPPPEYNVLEDEIARERGLLDLIRRAFTGETIHLPATWYDPRELKQVHIEEGNLVAIETTLFPLFDRDGAVRYVAIVFKDVTAELTARDVAEAAERRAHFLSEAGAVLVGSHDYAATLQQVAQLAVPVLADYCIVDVCEDADWRRVATVHADPSMKAVLDDLQARYPPGPDSPHPAARAIRSGEPELLAEIDERAIADHTLDEGHGALIRKLELRSHMAVPLKVRGRVLGALSLGRTGRSVPYSRADLELAGELARRAASAIETAWLYRQAQQAIRVRDEFLSIASHELKTPLTPLQLQLDHLRLLIGRLGVADEALLKRLDQANRQTQRLARLVDDLLDVSRIALGRLPLEREDVDLAELARDVVERFGDTARRAGCAITVTADAPAVGRWDRVRLEQVVSNLLSNAIKYGANHPIEIVVDASDGVSRLSVRDFGIGIAAEDAARIFDRFERAASVRHFGGMGLGLYITRELIEAHGGTITVRSEPGLGSTFTVVLPLANVLEQGRRDGAMP